MPGDLQWVSQIAAGQQGPQGDEDKLTQLSNVWYSTADQVSGFGDQLGPLAYGMRDAVSGPAGDQFQAMIGQLGSMTPQMVDGARQVGDMAKNTAVQTQYSKLM